MATAVSFDTDHDHTDLGLIFRGAVTLAVIQAIMVIVVSIITRSLNGTVEHALTGIVVFVGAMVTIFYPATLTHPRSIDGIASAAGIGLGATGIFVLLDAFILRTLHVYTNRWWEIGGGSYWWYLPVWWMAGTFLSWMGGWIIANQANRTGSTSIPSAVVMVTVFAAVFGVLANLIHFPLASWTVPTFAIAILPGLALATVVGLLAARRR